MKSKEKQNNIVIINNLPSNMVKEAIIVLRREYNFENTYNKKFKENIVKEAENVIIDFIKDSEREKEKKETIKIKRKYKISKGINYFTISCLLLLIFLTNIS